MKRCVVAFVVVWVYGRLWALDRERLQIIWQSEAPDMTGDQTDEGYLAQHAD